MKFKRIVSDEEAWRVCLELWRRLSISEELNMLIFPKEKVLRNMGYIRIKHNCPLCERHHLKSTCPLGDCSTTSVNNDPPCVVYTPYGKWVYTLSFKDAKEFYKYLLNLDKKQRKKPENGVC